MQIQTNNRQPLTTTNPITTVTTSHLNHKLKRKINKSQPATAAHPATTTHKPIATPKTYQKPRLWRNEKPTHSQWFQIRDLSGGVCRFQNQIQATSNGAAVIRLTSGLSWWLLRRQKRSRSDGGATKMEVKGDGGC